MNNRLIRNCVAASLAVIIVFVSIFAHTTRVWATEYYIAYEVEKKGVIIDVDGRVNVRSTPTTSTSTNLTGIQLDYRDRVTVIGEDKEQKKDSEEFWTWYHIKFTKDGVEYIGYVRGDLMEVYEPVTEADEAAIRAEITALGFPKSYIEPLVQLKMLHPTWNFVPYFTNYDWNKMLSVQLERNRNLVQDSSLSSWKSIEYGYFDWVNNTWTILEGNDRVKASQAIIEYYMDPRNFFDEKQIFQFEMLGYDESIHTLEGVENVLKNSFMANTVMADDAEKRTYAQAFLQIGKELSLSPYYLASKVIIEQGRKGTSSLISGTYSGYEGYYNFFNIGASGVGNTEIITNGLLYAKNHGWNTRYASLYGGASGTISNYIKRGQNTLYLQRFDVVDLAAGSYPRQYAQYVWSAYTEASSTATTYFSMGLEDSELAFRIPVYDNMPESACPKPLVDGNPNYKLNSIKVDNYALTPSFDTDTLNYSLIVDADVESVNVSALAYAATTSIKGTGKITLNYGENVVKIVATAENGDTRTYTVTITRKSGAINELSSLAIQGHMLTPAFDSKVLEYSLTVPYTTETINIGANPYAPTSTVEGIGEKKLIVGTNRFEIKVTGTDGSANIYVITVNRSNDVEFLAPNYTIDETRKYIHSFKIGNTVEEVLANLQVTNGTVKILDSQGNVATGNIATGQKVVVYNAEGNVRYEYTVVLYGDVNGDGKVSMLDRTILKRYIWGSYELNGALQEAGDTNRDGKVSLIDRTYLKRAIWNLLELVQ